MCEFCVGSLFLLCGSWWPFLVGNHLAEKERIGCFTLIVLWPSVLCFVVAVVPLPYHQVPCDGLQSMIVAFTGNIHSLFHNVHLMIYGNNHGKRNRPRHEISNSLTF